MSRRGTGTEELRHSHKPRQRSAVSGQRAAGSGQRAAGSGQRSAVSGQWSVVSGQAFQNPSRVKRQASSVPPKPVSGQRSGGLTARRKAEGGMSTLASVRVSSIQDEGGESWIVPACQSEAGQNHHTWRCLRALHYLFSRPLRPSCPVVTPSSAPMAAFAVKLFSRKKDEG